MRTWVYTSKVKAVGMWSQLNIEFTKALRAFMMYTFNTGKDLPHADKRVHYDRLSASTGNEIHSQNVPCI
jgi:hypothetical protein